MGAECGVVVGGAPRIVSLILLLKLGLSRPRSSSPVGVTSSPLILGRFMDLVRVGAFGGPFEEVRSGPEGRGTDMMFT